MKALFMESASAYDMTLRDTTIIEPGPEEVIIKVHTTGICGTDIKIYQGDYAKLHTPVILGHEFSGTIEAIGTEVKGLSLGENVTASPGSNCNKCHMCLEGKFNICENKKRIGFEVNGSFAEYVKVHHEQIHVLPKEIDLTEGALLEPISVVVHGLRNILIKPTDVVLIIGPGPIGLIALQLCKASGATVAISGLTRDVKKLTIARRLGADFTINAENGESEYDQLFDKTNGEGPNVVIECTGSANGVNKGLELCRPGGSYVQIGTYSHKVNIDFMQIAYKEINVTGSYSHTKLDWKNSIELLKSGVINVESLIQEVYPFVKWEQAFKEAEQGNKAKILLTP